MAFWTNDTYCKIWKITKNEKYTDISISTSEKDTREEGKYINSNWFARCVGKAHNQIAKMVEGDRVKIEKAKISNETYTAKDGTKKSALKVLIFSFDDTNGVSPNTTKAKKTTKTDIPDGLPEENDIGEDDVPF